MCRGTCEDGLPSFEESDIDCGGACEPCEDGKLCGSNLDCESGNCVDAEDGRRCARAGCTDGILNAEEEAIDCGGDCGGEPCPVDCDENVEINVLEWVLNDDGRVRVPETANTFRFFPGGISHYNGLGLECGIGSALGSGSEVAYRLEIPEDGTYRVRTETPTAAPTDTIVYLYLESCDVEAVPDACGDDLQPGKLNSLVLVEAEEGDFLYIVVDHDPPAATPASFAVEIDITE